MTNKKPTAAELAEIFANRGESLAAMDANTFTRNSAALNDKQLEDFLAGSSVQGGSDFIDFYVIFGFDSSGDDFIVIKNGMTDGLHFVSVYQPEGGK